MLDLHSLSQREELLSQLSSKWLQTLLSIMVSEEIFSITSLSWKRFVLFLGCCEPIIMPLANQAISLYIRSVWMIVLPYREKHQP